ncbi:hypothetical protein [Nitrosomonas oligotropha]|uniref:PD(D/E)XK endonuclease domain-containing protein n=1 Tax=Nitrosomonas oligotropha TaxID=42354 RepID=A0A1H8KC65_9PROT|nr:hypothetical protein [Nitrosomonas oligotropha]SDW29684.1 hypothetical protein SAMN05216300_10369 [Nitrosomonas oligotropha]SEN90271.1 hypothetical protein SAMN05216333_10269 [Nitrosomonas oligotropha]
MKYVGKYGEYRVLACLLEQNVEIYPAIKTNQPDFDLTAIPASGKIVRIQVKTTELSNKSTNNAIKCIDKQYDFLVIVIVDKNKTRFFVMTKSEALAAKGDGKLLSTTKQQKKESQVKDILLPYEDKWEKIVNA